MLYLTVVMIYPIAIMTTAPYEEEEDSDTDNTNCAMFLMILHVRQHAKGLAEQYGNRGHFQTQFQERFK